MELNRNETYPQEFRVFLQDELVRRIRQNPKYSMRTFAKFLGVESSRLSKMLRGQRPIRGSYVEVFGNKIGLRPDIIEDYKRTSDSRIRSSFTQNQDKTYQQLALDTFEIISDWQHFAILELMKLKGFEPTSKWISAKLGTSVNETSAAIERLNRVGLIVVNNDGAWKDTSEGFSTVILGKNTTTNAHKKWQEQLLIKAIDALHNIPIEKRDQSSMTMATSVEKLSKAKDMIHDFRRNLTAFLEDTNDKDAIYQLSVSLYPLSRISQTSNDLENQNSFKGENDESQDNNTL